MTRASPWCLRGCGISVIRILDKLEIIPLTRNSASAIDDAIDYAATLIGEAPPYDVSAVQALYNVLLEENEVDSGKLISLGVIFGELVRKKAKYEWVRVSDDFGEENALSPLGTTIVLYPISMMQKRLRSGETVNIAALRDGAIEYVDENLISGNYESR